MNNPVARLARAALFAAAVAVSAGTFATPVTTNYSDLWATPSEPGWGLNISQQADVMFATLFIYDKGELPAWYSVTLTYQSTGPNGVVNYSGDLYRTTGPALGQPWNPALLKYELVGQLSLGFGDPAHASLVYSIDKVLVTKAVTRLTFAAQSVLGKYIGATSDVTYDCKDPARNGIVTTDPGPFTITQQGTDVVLKFPTCTITGKYTQQGQIGEIDAIYECTNFAVGEIRFSALQSEKGGIVGNYTGRDKSCFFRGNIGGMRELP